MHLLTGDAYSAFVLGTRGEMIKVVTLMDRGAPLVRRVSDRVAQSGVPAGRVVVERGDSLWTIARRVLGRDASDEAVWQEVVSIWDRNESRIGTGDPNLIFAGTVLDVPAKSIST